MTLDKQLNEITEADLKALIAANVREGKDIEFKGEINLSTDDAKRKFLRNVAAFANTQGGHIIFGIEEQNGVATSLHALLNFNEDSEKLKLRDFIRAHIEPKVYGFNFHAVPLAGGGHALVLWVPRGWAGPHMVKFDKDNRFYFRHGNGTTLMDAGEIRTAFATAESLPGRIGTLRLDRASAISGGDVPMQFAHSQVLLFHIIPISAFDPLHDCDLSAVMSQDRKSLGLLPTMFEDERTYALEYDFDSVFKMHSDGTTAFGYTKLFRSGILEVTDCFKLRLQKDILGQAFRTNGYERCLFEYLPRWLETMKVAGLEPPLFAALTLIGMSGRTAFLDPHRFHFSPVRRSIRHDPLLIQPSVIESFDADALKILLPIFNRVWQACGRESTVNVDNDGNWMR